MRVENVLLYKTPMFCLSSEPTPEKMESQGRNVETSVYNQKGVTLSFGLWAKGQNAAEEACIKLFRKVRNGRVRQYTEPDIISFMQNLKIDKDGYRNTLDELKSIFLFYKESAIMNCESSLVPDAKYMNNILNITKDRDEREFWGVIEFARYELDSAVVRPLESLANAKPEHQDKFVGLLVDINEVNNPFTFPSEEMRERTVEGLYDDLRQVMYAAEEASSINDSEKLEYISSVYGDLQFFQKEKGFASEQDREKVLKISRKIFEIMMDVLKI